MAADEIELARRYPVYFPGWSKIIQVVSSPDEPTHAGGAMPPHDQDALPVSINMTLGPDPNKAACGEGPSFHSARSGLDPVLSLPAVGATVDFDLDFDFDCPTPLMFFGDS